jgi:hypothetical protein
MKMRLPIKIDIRRNALRLLAPYAYAAVTMHFGRLDCP